MKRHDGHLALWAGCAFRRDPSVCRTALMAEELNLESEDLKTLASSTQPSVPTTKLTVTVASKSRSSCGRYGATADIKRTSLSMDPLGTRWKSALAYWRMRTATSWR